MRTCEKWGTVRPDSQAVCDCEEPPMGPGPRATRGRWHVLLLRGCFVSVAFLSVALVGCYIVAPCFLHFPAQDGMGDGSLEIGVQSTMRDIVDAESRFFGSSGRYGNLIEIGRRQRSASYEIRYGYALMLSSTGKHYQLTATPSIRSTERCCFLGFPRCRYFYTDDSRILRSDRHCQPATRQSPQMRWFE